MIKKTVKEIEDVFKQVKAENIVIYPYAHLSSSLSSPDTALNVLKGIEKGLSDKKYPVKSAPFGYYKHFHVSVKGHPLSELSKQIYGEGVEKGDEESQAIKAEKKLKSSWFVIKLRKRRVNVAKNLMCPGLQI